MRTATLRRTSVIHNLEKVPLSTGRTDQDALDQLDRVSVWISRIGFAVLILFYMCLIGMTCYAAVNMLGSYDAVLNSL